MILEERIAKSRTTLFKAVFAELTNHHNMMLGGKAMEIMDEIAFITATRFCRKGFVTAGSIVDYKKPIPAETLIEVVGEVVNVGTTSLKVSVKIFVEFRNFFGNHAFPVDSNGSFLPFLRRSHPKTASDPCENPYSWTEQCVKWNQYY